ncbi:MAG: hypothetical protein MJ185_11055 [Treponema sp.]|nr:hypothetical protein [Treponema sp.]
MKKTFLITAILGALLTLASCASNPKGKITRCEPKGTEFTMLCGVITAECTGYENYMHEVTLNGTHKKGIELTIRDLTTKKEYKVKTEEHGFFYLPKAQVGHSYKLVKVHLEKWNGNYFYWAEFDFDNKDSRPITCKNREGNVLYALNIESNNGNWISRHKGNADWVKSILKLNYPGSVWPNYDFYYY